MLSIDTPVVLVVEDDPPVRGLLSEVLEEEGYQVVAVHDGPTALQVIESLKVDLITLDLDLPGLSGSELLDVLRKRKVKLPPVVVVTSTKPIRRQIKQMAQSVITKPFDIDELLFAVLELLPRRMPRAEAKAQQIVAREAAAELAAERADSVEQGGMPQHRTAGQGTEPAADRVVEQGQRRSRAKRGGSSNGQPPGSS